MANTAGVNVQITTTFLTIYDGYYKSEDLITIHDITDTTFDNELDNIIASPLCGNAYLKLTVNDNKWTFILNHFKERTQVHVFEPAFLGQLSFLL